MDNSGSSKDDPLGFCVKPFVEVNIMRNGPVKPCCLFYPAVSEGGEPMSVYSTTLSEIWNSDDLRDVRRKLSQGLPVSQCRYCYAQEKSGAQSMRQIETEAWKNGWLNPNQRTILDLTSESKKNDYRILSGPEWINIEVGNLCNLKCRMCHPNWSSSIAADPVHSRWIPNEFGSIARWRGQRLVIAPERITSVKYGGLSDVDPATKPLMAWVQGSATFIVEDLKDHLLSLYLIFFNPGTYPISVAVELNGCFIYGGHLQPGESKIETKIPERERLSKLLDIKIQVSERVGIVNAGLVRKEEKNNQIIIGRGRDGKQWFQDHDFISSELLYDKSSIKRLSIVGGEPFLIKSVPKILKQLVEAGISGNIELYITTNATTSSSEIYDLCAFFAKTSMMVSLEGFAQVNEYIRFPSKWSDIDRNIQAMKRIPNTHVAVNMTVQAYNMMHVAELASYCIESDIDFWCPLLVNPAYLSVFVMPPAARDYAARKLLDFSDDVQTQGEHAQAQSKLDVLRRLTSLAREMSVEANRFDRDKLFEFMQFTNDLDESRGQSFRSINNPILQFLEAEGFTWNHQKRFAGS